MELIARDKTELANLRRKITPLAEYLLRDIVVYSAGNAGRTNDIELELEEGNVAVPENYFMKMIEEVLDNAYKFSERGKPIKIQSNTLHGFYFIHITDYGHGMTRKQIDNIGAHIQFERRIYEQQGAGLGLAIVKAITKLVGGDLIIKSEPNVFTTVSLKLPLAKNIEEL